jgi:hypothetical protein
MNTWARLSLNRLRTKSLFKLSLLVVPLAILLTVCGVPALAQMPLASAPTVATPMSSAIPGDYGPPEAPASTMGTYSPTHSPTQPRLDVNLLGEPAYGPAPLTVDFLVIMPNPPSSLVYQWHFGDGSASSLPASTIIPHVYTHAGTYLCALVVTASNGLSTTVFTTVDVRPADPKQEN